MQHVFTVCWNENSKYSVLLLFIHPEIAQWMIFLLVRYWNDDDDDSYLSPSWAFKCLQINIGTYHKIQCIFKMLIRLSEHSGQLWGPPHLGQDGHQTMHTGQALGGDSWPLQGADRTGSRGSGHPSARLPDLCSSGCHQCKYSFLNPPCTTPTPISVHIWGWYFLAPHTHVLCMVSGSATGSFPAVRLVHSLPKYICYISVLILNSSLHYQIFEFDTNIIQILVWIIGSTYRKGEILKQIWHVNRQFFTVTQIHMGLGVHCTR